MKVKRLFDANTDRYAFDWGPCHFKMGYAQIDTPQDASYFGTWANPFRLRIVEYSEGDITVQTADTDTEFTTALRYVIDAWNRNYEGQPQVKSAMIDGMCDEEIIAKFEALGLADLLH